MLLYITRYSSVIRFAEQSLDPEMRQSVFSPRLMEVVYRTNLYELDVNELCNQFSYLNQCFVQAVIWFLARWSCTYLMPPEENRELNSRKVLLGFFGQHNQGKLVLDIIVRISMTALVSYPGEKDLQVCVKESFS